MPNEFLNPNWHAISVHAPIGLLGIGVMLEVITFLWPKSTLRTAGRWMMLLGTLLMIPAAALGIYAFRDVVTGGPIDDHQTWHKIVEVSPWQADQWQVMWRHILLMSMATGMFVMGVLVWLGSRNGERRILRWPVLLIMLAGVAVTGAGGWNAGEAIYRYGTAVERPAPPPTTAPAVAQAKAPEQPTGVDYFLPPMQLHVLLAGLAVMLTVGALAATLRRWATLPSELSPWQAAVPTAWQQAPATPYPPLSAKPTDAGPTIYPARFWLLAFLVAAGAAVVGLWVANDWTLEEGFRDALEDPTLRKQARGFYHVIFGASIILLPLLLALITRIMRRGKIIVGLFVLLQVLALAAQFWLGILLLFDGHYGPLTTFNP